MTIVEVLPGNGGWYTQILTPLTAEQGRLIGVTYPENLWVQMFPSWNEDSYERFGADITQMGRYMSIDGVESAQPIVGYTIDNIPDEEDGQADAVFRRPQGARGIACLVVLACLESQCLRNVQVIATPGHPAGSHAP